MAAQRSLAYAACLALLYLLPAVAAVATNSKAHLPPHQLLALARVGQHAWCFAHATFAGLGIHAFIRTLLPAPRTGCT